MTVWLPYGRRQFAVELAGLGGRIEVLEPRRGVIDPIRLALAAPIASRPLQEIVRPGQSIVIITSDVTRPCPTHLMLPPVMEALTSAGVRDKDVTVVFALGTHRPQTAAERARLVGPEMAARLRCVDSDPENVIRVGTTSRGTPVEVFAPVVAAQVRIVLGNVEPHYFAGYSGGVKALAPGVCSAETIRHNHALMVENGAMMGVLDENPVRADLEEAAALVGVDFMLNVIVNGAHEVVLAAAGHPREAHRWLCRALDYTSKTPLAWPADIVLVGAGGAPKDINLYQAQKALDSAALAVRPGGVIIWVAECPEGFGHAAFEEWLLDAAPDDILARLQRGFVLGGHKAAAIARTLKRATVLLVSHLPAELVRRAGMRPYADVASALQAACELVGPLADCVVLPEGAAVLPALAPEHHAAGRLSQGANT